MAAVRFVASVDYNGNFFVNGASLEILLEKEHAT